MIYEVQKTLEIAESYLDDAEKLAPTANDIVEENGDEYLRLLSLASKQLEKASSLDATLDLRDNTKINSTNEDFYIVAARELLYRSFAYGIGQNNPTKGVELIKKAIEFRPTKAQYHALHAGFLIDLGKKEEALAAIREAIKLDSNEITYHKLENEIESYQKSFQGSQRTLLVFGGIALLGMILIFSGSGKFGFFMTLAGGGLGWVYWTKNTK